MTVRKAVITAAGRGTRMFPATRTIQKEMLPVVDTDGVVRPVLQIIAQSCVDAGIDEICVVVEKGGGAAFRDHFRPMDAAEAMGFAGKDWAVAEASRIEALAQRISYVEQPSPEGFGHAVLQAREFVGGEPFLLLLGDHLTTAEPGRPSCLRQVTDAMAASRGSVTGVLLEIAANVPSTGIVRCGLPGGVDAPRPGACLPIERLWEKPSLAEAESLRTPGLPDGTWLGHFGIHGFDATIFDCLQELVDHEIRVKGEYQLTSAQERLLGRALAGDGAPYHALLVDGTRWDIGVPEEYRRTVAGYGL